MKRFFFIALAFILSACTATETIILNESRSDQLKRYSFSDSETSTLIAKNISNSSVTLTVNEKTFVIQAGDKLELKIDSGFYKVDSQKYVFTSVNSRKGYDIEFLPAFEYRTELK